MGEGTDRVIPNTALLAWLEQQTGKPARDLFNDEQGEDPWRELRDLVSVHSAWLSREVPGFAEALAWPEQVERASGSD